MLPKIGIGIFSLDYTPSGVIELPVVLLSSAIEIRVGYEVFKKVGKEENVKKELKRGLKLFVSRIVSFLLLAAIIETFATPLLIWVEESVSRSSRTILKFYRLR